MPREPLPMPSGLGLMAELRSLPRLHRVLVILAMICVIGMALEGAVLVPYIVFRWGWGYHV